MLPDRETLALPPKSLMKSGPTLERVVPGDQNMVLGQEIVGGLHCSSRLPCPRGRQGRAKGSLTGDHRLGAQTAWIVATTSGCARGARTLPTWFRRDRDGWAPPRSSSAGKERPPKP